MHKIYQMMQYFNKNVENLRKKFKVCSFLKIDFSFFLLLVLAILIDDIVIYFWHVLFVVLHEMSHFFMAKKLGYLPQKIHLTFFGASLEGEDDFLVEDELKIILVGPVFNLCMIVTCYLMFWFEPESYIFLHDVLIANWSIFMFNMLPIFPLDMGRFLLVLLNKKFERKVALEKTKRISLLFVFVLFSVFLISLYFEYNFTLGFVCVNLASLLMKSAKDTSYKRQLFAYKKFEKLKKGLVERTVYVFSGCPTYKLYRFIDEYHFFRFVFVDKNNVCVSSMTEFELYESDGLLG